MGVHDAGRPPVEGPDNVPPARAASGRPPRVLLVAGAIYGIEDGVSSSDATGFAFAAAIGMLFDALRTAWANAAIDASAPSRSAIGRCAEVLTDETAPRSGLGRG